MPVAKQIFLTMRTVVFAALLLGVAFALTTEEAIDQISRIDNTKFGHTLFETIFIQLETGDPLDTLLDTLAFLEDQLVAEQKESDANNRDFQSSCDYDIGRLDKDLAESNTYRVQLEAKLEGALYPQRSIFQGLVASKSKEVASLNKDVDELDNTRAEEKDEFEEKVREHNQATEIITEARRLFEGLISESFLQKTGGKISINKQGLSLVQKKLHDGAKSVKKFKYRKSYGSLFKIFATITNSAQQLADAGALNRIVDLANSLLERIQESLDLERSAEDARIEAYKKARKLLTITLNNANTVLANLQVELASTEDAITRTETALENTEQRIANLSEERSDRWNVCEEAAADYESERSTRSQDRQTISDAIGLVNSQLRTLREQLALRLAAGDNI